MIRLEHYCPGCRKHFMSTCDLKIKALIEDFKPSMLAGQSVTGEADGVLANDLADVKCRCGDTSAFSLEHLKAIQADTDGVTRLPKFPKTQTVSFDGRTIVVLADKVDAKLGRVTQHVEVMKCRHSHECDEDLNALVDACFQCLTGALYGRVA